MGCFMSLLGSRKPIEGATKSVGSRKESKIISAGSERLGKDRNEVSRPKSASKGPQQATTKLIAVVGRTGSGLSQFIHDVTDAYKEGVAPDASLQPYTQEFKAISTQLKSSWLQSPKDEGTSITLIDTPGFDYSRGNDEFTTLRELAKWLRRQYGPKVKLDGVIYMHNIWNEEIYNRSKFLSSPDLEKLCGPFWHRKIILVNSHWSERLGDDGEDREKHLREGYWSFMIKKGSIMKRYESPGNHMRAREILKPFL